MRSPFLAAATKRDTLTRLQLRTNSVGRLSKERLCVRLSVCSALYNSASCFPAMSGAQRLSMMNDLRGE